MRDASLSGGRRLTHEAGRLKASNMSSEMWSVELRLLVVWRHFEYQGVESVESIIVAMGVYVRLWWRRVKRKLRGVEGLLNVAVKDALWVEQRSGSCETSKKIFA